MKTEAVCGRCGTRNAPSYGEDLATGGLICNSCVLHSLLSGGEEDAEEEPDLGTMELDPIKLRDTVVNELRTGTDLTKANTAALVAFLAIKYPNGYDAIREAGILEPLVELAGSGTDEQRESAAKALQQLSVGNSNMKRSLIEAGAIEPLVQLSKFGTNKQKANALKALENLSRDDGHDVQRTAAPQSAKFEIGQKVRLQGLVMAADKNGAVGFITSTLKGDGRHSVRLEQGGKLLAVKPENLVPIAVSATMIHCVEVTRIGMWREVQLPADVATRGAQPSPVMNLVGFPILLQKVLEREGRNLDSERRNEGLDNEVACYFMIDPESGFAPPRWQSNIGPVIISRVDGKPLTLKQVGALWQYFNEILDSFGDDARSARRMMKPRKFKEWLRDYQDGGLPVSFD